MDFLHPDSPDQSTAFCFGLSLGKRSASRNRTLSCPWALLSANPFDVLASSLPAQIQHHGAQAFTPRWRRDVEIARHFSGIQYRKNRAIRLGMVISA